VQPEPDLPARRGELDRVGQQVFDHLADSRRVAQHERQLKRHLDLQVEARSVGGAQRRHQLPPDLGQIEGREDELRGAGLQP